MLRSLLGKALAYVIGFASGFYFATHWTGVGAGLVAQSGLPLHGLSAVFSKAGGALAPAVNAPMSIIQEVKGSAQDAALKSARQIEAIDPSLKPELQGGQAVPAPAPAEVGQPQTAKKPLDVQHFLADNGQFWVNPEGPGSGRPFDVEFAMKAFGDYDGQVNYFAGDTRYQSVLQLRLRSVEEWENVLVVKDSAGAVSDGNTPFRTQLIGTDVAQGMMNVVFPSPHLARAGIWQIAFKLPVPMTAGQVHGGDVYGLTEDLVWAKLGKVSLKKVQ